MPKVEPQRSCLGCGAVKEKSELLRFVLAPDRTLVPDLKGKLPGRGAYTCINKTCLQSAAARKQFARTFKGEVKDATADQLLLQVSTLFAERILAYLALANKAGKVISGSDMVMDACKKGHHVGIVFVAADISVDIGQKVLAYARQCGAECVTLFDKDRLGALLGKGLRSVAAVQESGFIQVMQQEIRKYRNFADGGVC